MATYILTRQRNQFELSTRWDSKKLDAYESYVDKVRATVSAALVVYRARGSNDQSTDSKSEDDVREALKESVRVRSRAFERVMLLGGDEVIEAAHHLNAVVEELIWHARGEIHGTDEDWLRRFRSIFQAINGFHDTARKDLGIQGSVTGPRHPERDVLMPPEAELSVKD